ncbi:MAG: CPBP family intramembrane metalloprotease [Clostridia bacterium]|nr:CPBP family intramembrane metalloprotease [Clostridia bacterium]
MKTNYPKLIVLTVIFSLSLAAATLMSQLLPEQYREYDVIATVLKIVLIAGFIRYIKLRQIPVLRKCNPLFFLYAVIPFIFACLLSYSAPGQTPKILLVISSAAGVITTCIVEELFFRTYMLSTIKPKDQSVKQLLIFSVFFSLAHAINFFFNDWLSTTLQLIIAFSFATVVIEIYWCTNNILTTVIPHLAMNITSTFFALFGTKSGNSNTIIIASSIVGFIIINSAIVAVLRRKREKSV